MKTAYRLPTVEDKSYPKRPQMNSKTPSTCDSPSHDKNTSRGATRDVVLDTKEEIYEK